MTARYAIRLADGLIEVTYHPDSTPEDHLEAAREALNWLREHCRGLLIDWRAARALPSVDLAHRIVETAADHLELLAQGVAFLAEPGVNYGVARIEQALGELESIEVAVFTDRETAVAWL